MKLKNILMLMALTLGTFTFVACGDDDEEQTGVVSAEQAAINKKVVGTYTGWTHLTTNYIDKNYADDTIELKQEKDGTLTAVFTDKTWGTATIKGCAVHLISSNSTSAYSMEPGKGEFAMYNPRNNTTQTFPCELAAGLISFDKDFMAASIVADMSSVEGGHGKMTFVFTTGEMPLE